MKKTIVTLLLAITMIGSLSAQADTKNLGLRVGPGIEASYQHPLNESHRLEFDLGVDLFDNGFTASAVYQWVWDLSALYQGFNWYVGVGAGLGAWDKSFMLAALGQIGIEYNFNIPLQLSLDWRPGLSLVFNDGVDPGFWGSSVGVGARYKF